MSQISSHPHKLLTSGLPNFTNQRNHERTVGGLRVVDQHPTSLTTSEHASRVIIPDDANHRTPARAITRAVNGFTQPDTPKWAVLEKRARACGKRVELGWANTRGCPEANTKYFIVIKRMYVSRMNGKQISVVLKLVVYCTVRKWARAN
jgi:hypothetical protein